MKIMVTVRAQPEITEFLCPVGHYTVDLMSVLGRGEFGVVLKAFSGSSKPIAAKRYCPKPNDWELLLSAANALKLDNSHENVLLVLDVINTEDSVWIFMELCWGNVEDWFRTRRDSVELDTKLDLMRQITQGVSFLHDRNIIHRDIKPSNVLLHSEVCNYVYHIPFLAKFQFFFLDGTMCLHWRRQRKKRRPLGSLMPSKPGQIKTIINHSIIFFVFFHLSGGRTNSEVERLCPVSRVGPSGRHRHHEQRHRRSGVQGA